MGIGKKKKIQRLLTPADKILVVTVLLCSIGGEIGRLYSSSPGAEAVVEVDGVIRSILPLGQPRKVQIEGPLGSCEIEIGTRGARVVRAPCPHGICMRRGWIRQEGEVVVCVPNRLVLAIVGGEERNEVDAVIR